MIQNKPGSWDQEDETQYYSGKEALGKLGNMQFSGHNLKRLCPALVCLGKEPHSKCAEQVIDLAFAFEENFPRNRYAVIANVIISLGPKLLGTKLHSFPQHSLQLSFLSLPAVAQSSTRHGLFISVKHKLPTIPLSNRLQVPCSIWRTAIFLLKCSKEGCTGTLTAKPSSMVTTLELPPGCRSFSVTKPFDFFTLK